MPDAVPVLFDTDIGSDIDDAVALAYLLRQPRCDLVGITTVTGDVAKRAALAEVLCRAAGRDGIPIHLGASSVLLHGPGQPDVPQYEAIASRAHRPDRPANTAVDFMRRTIRERPGEITLLSVGPLTNVALLFALDPELPALLRAWVSMAGRFFGDPDPDVDWNSICDPVASALAFRHQPPRHLHVGLDVTLRCRLSADDVRSRFTGPLLGAVLVMAARWFNTRSAITFHDPLAAAVVFEPGLCDFKRGHVSVNMEGHTSFSAGDSGPDQVAATVDVPAFFDHYFAVTAE